MGMNRINAQIHLSGQNFDMKLDYQDGSLIARLYNGEPVGAWPAKVKLADIVRARLRIHHGDEGVDLRSPWVKHAALYEVTSAAGVAPQFISMPTGSPDAFRLVGWLVNLDGEHYNSIHGALMSYAAWGGK